MVVVPPPRARLRIAADPDADVDGVNGAAAPVAVRRILGEQVPQPLLVDPPVPQGGIEAAPAAPVGRRQAQVDRRGHRAGGQQCIGQLEQRVGSAAEATVERVPEGMQGVEGFGRGVHGGPSCYRRSPMSTFKAVHDILGLKDKRRPLNYKVT